MSIIKDFMSFVKEDKSENKTWTQLLKKWLNYLVILVVLTGFVLLWAYYLREPIIVYNYYY